MTTLLDEYADTLAELLDEGMSVDDALEHIDGTIIGDVTIEEVVKYFTEVYETTPEDYHLNIEDDSRWAIEHDLVGVHFDDDDLDIQILDDDFDRL